MATYTKETALYDTGAIADGISGAGETASNYITDVSGGGVYVHSADTPASPSSATAKGVRITDDIDIIRNGKSVASFGDSIILRRDDNGELVECFSVNPSEGIGTREISQKTPDLQGTGEYNLTLDYEPTSGQRIDYFLSASGDGTTAGNYGAFTAGRASSGTLDGTWGSVEFQYDGDRSILVSYDSASETMSLDLSYTIEANLPYYNIGSRTGNVGPLSTVIGENLEAGYENQVVIGRNNYNLESSIFEIGRGTGTDRSNALTVDRNGNLTAAGEVMDGFGNKLSSFAGTTASGTVNSNITVSRAQCRLLKIGNVVFITVAMGNVTSSVNTNTNLFTIPSAYRPSSNVTLQGRINDSVGNFTVRSDGYVRQTLVSALANCFCAGFYTI